MEPLGLFQKWRRKRECTPKEAWMAGYAAGCHQGYRKGRLEGRAEGEREREVLIAALRTFLDRTPWEFDQGHGRDARDDRFLLTKLLFQTRRGKAPGWHVDTFPARATGSDD